jgi:hypothetical protein
MAENPHVMVATPCYGGMTTAIYTRSMLALAAACAGRGVRLSAHIDAAEAMISKARAELAAVFMESDATHLMFIDADIGFEPDQFFRLLSLDVDVAAASYPFKRIDWEKARRVALAGLPNLEAASLDYVVDWGVDNTPIAAVKDFARVRRAPMGFMLIRRSVVQRLREAHPELRYKHISRHGDHAKDLPYRFALFESTIEEGGLYLTEDYAFCRRWTELGGEIWLDIKSRLTHYGPHAFRGDLLQQFRKPSES